LQRGEIYLAPFPFTDLARTKRRPVCVASDQGFNAGDDVVVAMITSRQSRIVRPGVGDFVVGDWAAAGLLAASVLRAGRLWTSEKRLLGAGLGALTAPDILELDRALAKVLGLQAR
jgi:mRNA interferase MazF